MPIETHRVDPKYIIDFERINSLTTHANDNPKENYGGGYCYSISRKIIKEYIDVYREYREGSNRIGKEQYDAAVKTLKYNKILLTDSDIRDDRISGILC